jgi:hypothetical protein
MEIVGQSKRGDPHIQAVIDDDVKDNHFITTFLKESVVAANSSRCSSRCS